MTIVEVFIFYTIVTLAVCLTVIALRHNLILFRVSAFLTWFALGMIMLTDAFGTTIVDDWTLYLGWIFIMMSFSSLLIHMDTEITTESKGQRWTEWGTRPKNKETNYDRYKAELQRRTRRG